jgi:hypothetical protein
VALLLFVRCNHVDDSETHASASHESSRERRGRPAIGEERVARFVGRETCFGVIAVLSPDADDTLEFVPMHNPASTSVASLWRCKFAAVSVPGGQS